VLTGDPEALRGGPPVKAMLIQNTNPGFGRTGAGACETRALPARISSSCVHEQFMTETAQMADIVCRQRSSWSMTTSIKAAGTSI
jgi:anaerobic selenocysteine-containing dehydrogenase